MLNASQRLKVLNLTRDGMRNAPAVRAIVQQLRVLMVGLEGGKLTCTTEDEDWNKAAQTFFGKWARACDFVDNTCLNECLKLMVTCLHAEGGDFCMIFDDGILTGGRGTGKVRFFESDNIANLFQFTRPAWGASRGEAATLRAGGRGRAVQGGGEGARQLPLSCNSPFLQLPFPAFL